MRGRSRTNSSPMPEATRALISQKPAGVAVTRAALSTSHSSGTDSSPESGRLRRRRGKLKMQSRILELEGRIRTLTAIIHQMTLAAGITNADSCSGPPQRAAEHFDLYGDMDATSSANVATQTEISVDHQSPDIFVKIQDLPASALEGHTSAQCTAHADAAAGHAAAHDDLTTHRDASLQDTKSQNPALSARPVAFGANEQSTSHLLSHKSLDLANFSEPLADPALTPCGHLPLAQGTRQALDADHTEHRSTDPQSKNRVASTKDFSSQNLANMGVSQEADGPPVTGQRQALDDDNSEHRCASGIDISFQDLGCESKEQLRAAGLPKEASLQDHKSQDLAQSARPVAFGANERCSSSHLLSYNSQDLANFSEPLADLAPTQCGLLPPAQGTRQALDVDNSEHRSTYDKDSLKDFNSHNLASLAQPVAVGANEKSFSETRADLDLSQCATHNRLRNLTSISQEQDAAAGYKSQSQVSGSPGDDPFVFESAAADLVSRDAPGFQCTQHMLVVGDAKLCVSRPLDSSSMNLAAAAEPCAREGQSGTWQALDDTNAKHQGPDVQNLDRSLDYTSVSQDDHGKDHKLLESVSPGNALQDKNSSWSPFLQEMHFKTGFATPRTSRTQKSPNLVISAVADIAQRTPSPRQELEVGNSKHRGTEGEPAPQSSRQALEVGNSKHRDSVQRHSQRSTLFGPSERAHFQMTQNSLQSTSVGNDAKQLSADGASLGALGDLEAARAFKDAVAPIIAAYRKRRKPTNTQARAAARAIINVARQFPISKDECCAHLKEHSLVLWCVTTDLWL